MSRTEKITGELQALMSGVERAQGLAEASAQQAQEVALRAAGAGFASVAASMLRVREAITTFQGGLSGLTGAIDDATRATAAVPEGVSPQETTAGLRLVHSAIDAVRETTAGLISQVDGVRQLVATALQGGQPGPLLQTLGNVKETLALIAQRSDAARQSVDTAIAEAGQLGASGN